MPPSGRILVDARSGTVVAGGDVRVGPAVVSLGNITVRIGDQPAGAVPPGTVALPRGALVQDVAQGLHSLDVTSAQIAEVFEALRSVGALTAEVVVR
jgi:flagellar P-ring protein precursor FlgI